MIERYTNPYMRVIFNENNRYQAWLEVELLACEAWGELNIIDPVTIAKLRENASFDIERIKALELETKHDVIAFTRAVSETLGAERKWIHYGLTSTDVVDTANGYLFKQANHYLREAIYNVMEVIKSKALRYKYTPMIGRTHGIHAEITTFGHTMALWLEEMRRNLKRFEEAAQMVEVGKISGAVGTFANTPPFVQDYVCQQLGLSSSVISTQVLQRDRHAQYFATLALIGSSLEKFATQIRLLQQTELAEVAEYFSPHQKGSSAMPHKHNPIASENLVGVSRLLRGYMVSAFENNALWHQRDISHSSVERVIIPDAICLLEYALTRFARTLESLIVYEDKMLENISLTHNIVYSGGVLLALIEAGYSREEAYDLIQPLTFEAYENKRDFKQLVEDLNILDESQIAAIFDPRYHLKNIDEIYRRMGLVE